MASRIPKIFDRHKICIICEGAEEYEYLKKLNSLNVWSHKYDVRLISADGNGNIPARYQNAYQNGSYEIIFIFCDTDRKPYEQYSDIKRKINEFHGTETASNHVILFGNPCTMQVILQHYGNVSLTKSNKKKNSSIIEEYTGIKGYKAKKEQREVLFEMITVDNYKIMCERVKLLSKDDEEVGSSNFNILMERLESENSQWINMINEEL
ncbi:MAG: hypothetical protein HUJ53_10110 [Holdemanella sp.]|nr:hypothetical protein [Holdemanella sp.]